MTKLFETQPKAHSTQRHQEIFGHYQRIYLVNEFLVGLLFVIGSVLFFYKSTETAGVWLFVIASILFFLRPTIKLLREYHLANLPIPSDDKR